MRGLGIVPDMPIRNKRFLKDRFGGRVDRCISGESVLGSMEIFEFSFLVSHSVFIWTTYVRLVFTSHWFGVGVLCLRSKFLRSSIINCEMSEFDDRTSLISQNCAIPYMRALTVEIDLLFASRDSDCHTMSKIILNHQWSRTTIRRELRRQSALGALLTRRKSKFVREATSSGVSCHATTFG